MRSWFGRLGYSMWGVFAVLAALVLGAGPADAGSCSLTGSISTWALNANGSWSVSGNWNPAGAPNSGAQNVCIVDGSSTVTVDGGFSSGSVQIAGGNGLTISGGNSLSIGGTQLLNSGSFMINGGAGQNGSLQLNNTVTLSGGGGVVLTTQAGGGTAQIIQNASGANLTNVDNTLQGAGVIGNSGLGLTNQTKGIVNANANGGTLTLNGSNGVTNNGLLEATGGGILQIANAVNNAGTTAGTISGDNGTVSLVNGAFIQAGTLSTAGSGVVQSASSNSVTLDGRSVVNGGQGTLSNTGSYVVQSNSNTALLGTIANSGTITVEGGGGQNSSLQMANPVTLTGGGNVVLTTQAGGGTAQIIQSASGANLTNVDNTLQGAGVIGNSGLGLTNQTKGIVNANANGGTLTLNGSNGVTNQGLLEATGGGTLQINTGITNTGGTILASGGTVTNTSSISGGTLTTGTGGVMQSSGGGAALNGVTISTGSTYTTATGNTTTLTGTITNQGTLALGGGNGNNGTLQMANPVTLTGGGNVVLTTQGSGTAQIIQSASGANLTNVDNTLQGAGVIGNSGLGLTNQTKGTVNANASGQSLTLNGGGGVTNSGAFIASNGGTLSVATGLTNLSSGTLTGGTWQSVGSGSQLALSAGPVTSDAANITLSGAGSSFTANGSSLESSLAAVTAAGQLHVLNNRNYFTFNDITNAGLLDLGGGTFTANSVSNTGTLSGFGTVTNGNLSPLANTGGQVTATGGTLKVTQGINGSTGNITVNSGASLDLSSATVGSTVGTLLHNGSNLALGSQNITVSGDYNNASFGTGNSFNNHNAVSGSGLILAAGDVGLSVTGSSITGGAAPTLNLGVVHVGASNGGSFAINNTGTSGPVLRGAVQTSGLLNPAVGITAQNFGPIALGGSVSENYSFAPVTAGAISGQSFRVVSNFDNVAPVTVNVVGTATNLATPQITTPTPIFVGSTRVGTALPTVGVSVTNGAPLSSFSEGLIAAVTGTTGTGITASGGFGSPGASLAAGRSNTSGIQVGIDARSAGVKSGNAVVDFKSDGTAFAGGTVTDLGATNVAVTGNVYAPAVAHVTTTGIDFGTVHVHDVVTAQAITLGNAAAVAGLNDTLTGTIGSITGAGSAAFSSSGTLGGGIAAQGTDSTSLKVGLNTASSGRFSAAANLALFSHDSNLADLALGTAPIALTGTVDNYAIAAFHRTSGGGTFSGSGSNFVLDFGTVARNSGQESAVLAAFNAATGIADLLGGKLLVSGTPTADFSAAGLGTFASLGAGQAAGPFSIAFNPTASGRQSEVIDLIGTGSNSSGYSEVLTATLTIEADVTGSGGAPVPEPDSALLFGAAAAGLALVCRRALRG